MNAPVLELEGGGGPAGVAAAPVRCFHCGEEIHGEPAVVADIDGAPQPMCCNGCAAVARAISGAGLMTYYRRRDAYAERADDDAARAEAELACYDSPAIQAGFVRQQGESLEAALIVEGIRCAACVWLTETRIGGVDGVGFVQINYATRRAVVRWNPARTKLSRILAAVRSVGYRAHPYDPARQEQLLDAERRTALRRLFIAGIGMMQVMMYAFPAYVAAEGTMTWDMVKLMRIASWVLTSPVVLYSAAPFFTGAWRDLRLFRAGMDVPVALGIAAAYGASVWATLTGAGDVYFDSVTMFVFLLLAGRFLELLARRRALGSIEQVAAAQPTFANRLSAAGDLASAERVPVAALVPGDRVRIEPGERVPADGTVTWGSSEVDEALLTGESRPIAKSPGATLIGGATNVASPLVMRVDRIGTDTVLAAIVRLMDRALAARPAIALLADRIAAHFVAALLLASVAVGLVWAVHDPSRAVWITLSMLVVSCPCALSLATPAALAAATGCLSRAGVLVTRGHAIETLARATHVVFDKTGTLTRGAPVVQDVVTLGPHAAEYCLALAAALETGSEHPIARAIAAATTDRSLVPAVSRLANTAGRGIEGCIAGTRYRIGVADFVAEIAGPAPSGHVRDAGAASRVWLGGDEGWLAGIDTSDELRPEAVELVAELLAAGRHVIIMSGDGSAAVSDVARRLGVAEAYAAQTPADKLARLKALQDTGAVVVMVGDGVNDAPVLGAAHVSIAAEGSSQIAQSNADIVLTSGGLRGVGFAFETARATMRIVRQNLVWAVVYNAVAIPAAALGHVTPWMAGIGMSASSLLVVLNAVRLSRRTA